MFKWQGNRGDFSPAKMAGYLSWLTSSLVAFLAIFSLDPVNAPYMGVALQFTVRLGFAFGLLALLWYGGIQVLNHSVLRILLRFEKNIPPYYPDFLDRAVDLIFLRRVGSGYIFVHHLLCDYFAQVAESRPGR